MSTRIIREIEPLPWLCGIPEVLNWRQHLEYTDVYSIHPRYLPFKAVENHGTSHICRGCTCWKWSFSTKIARSDSPNLVVWWNPWSPIFGPNMAQCLSAPLGRGTSPQACQNSSAAWQIWTFRVFGKGVEWNSPPDASRCLYSNVKSPINGKYRANL